MFFFGSNVLSVLSLKGHNFLRPYAHVSTMLHLTEHCLSELDLIALLFLLFCLLNVLLITISLTLSFSLI